MKYSTGHFSDNSIRMIYDNFIMANGFRRHYHQTTPFGRHVNVMRDVTIATKKGSSSVDVSFRTTNIKLLQS